MKYLIIKSGERKASADNYDAACDLAEDIALAGSDAQVIEAYGGAVLYQAFAGKAADVTAARTQRVASLAAEAQKQTEKQAAIAEALRLGVTAQDLQKAASAEAVAEVARG
ncbi:MAG: hypothetical protein ACK50D_05195 [Burkholderiales bacterium]